MITADLTPFLPEGWVFELREAGTIAEHVSRGRGPDSLSLGSGAREYFTLRRSKLLDVTPWLDELHREVLHWCMSQTVASWVKETDRSYSSWLPLLPVEDGLSMLVLEPGHGYEWHRDPDSTWVVTLTTEHRTEATGGRTQWHDGARLKVAPRMSAGVGYALRASELPHATEPVKDKTQVSVQLAYRGPQSAW